MRATITNVTHNNESSISLLFRTEDGSELTRRIDFETGNVVCQGRNELSKICKAIGIYILTSSDDLIGKELDIDFNIRYNVTKKGE